jgi:hypothetical protein
MAYVEEEILEERIQFPPESLLFIVSDNWKPPSHIPASASTPAIFQQAQEAMEEATCIIEKELLEEFLHLDCVATIQNIDFAAEDLKAVEAMEADLANPGEEVTVLDMEVEGSPVLAPPPLSALPDLC